MEQYATKEDIKRIEDLLKELISKTSSNNNEEEWLKTSEAMKLLKFDKPQRIYQLVKKGLIKRSKTTGIKGSNRYNKAELLRMLESGLVT